MLRCWSGAASLPSPVLHSAKWESQEKTAGRLLNSSENRNKRPGDKELREPEGSVKCMHGDTFSLLTFIVFT